MSTLMEPQDANTDHLVSFKFAQDSPHIDCARPYSILDGYSGKIDILQAKSQLMASALSQGYYVVISDYEGPLMEFSTARVPAKATLDSIRAVLQTELCTGLSSSAKAVMWGYSGGSVPTSWVAVLQPAYAPDLGAYLIGAAFGGWLTDLREAALTIDGTYAAGIIPLAVHGLINLYPELSDLLRGQITNPENRT